MYSVSYREGRLETLTIVALRNHGARDMGTDGAGRGHLRRRRWCNGALPCTGSTVDRSQLFGSLAFLSTVIQYCNTPFRGFVRAGTGGTLNGVGRFLSEQVRAGALDITHPPYLHTNTDQFTGPLAEPRLPHRLR